jgi:hypothetical protein
MRGRVLLAWHRTGVGPSATKSQTVPKAQFFQAAGSHQLASEFGPAEYLVPLANGGLVFLTIILRASIVLPMGIKFSPVINPFYPGDLSSEEILFPLARLPHPPTF